MTEPPGRTRQELWDERHAGRDPIESRDPDPSLVRVAGPMRPGRALDLAAGDGRNAVWLAAQGWTVTAVDFSRVGLDRAATAAGRAGLTLQCVQADLLAWDPPQRAFDLVLVAFLHLPAPERQHVLQAAAEAVAPGGRLLVVGHDRTNLEQGAGGPQDPAVLYTADEVTAGLRGLHVEESGTARRDAGDGREAIDAVVVARRPPA